MGDADDEIALLRARLAASEARYRKTVERVRDGVVVTDAARRCTYVNRRFEEMLGFARGALTGRHAYEVLGPDGRAHVEAHAEQRRRGEPDSGETCLRGADGREVWVSFDSAPILDVRGEHTETVTVICDLTERRAADDRLRKSEEQLSEAQEVAQVGSWELDLRTNRITRSAELNRIYGASEGSLAVDQGMVFELVHPLDRARVGDLIRTSLARLEPYDVEFRYEREGQTRQLHARGRAVCDEAGRPLRSFGTVQDVTERYRTEERLRRREEQLREAQKVARVGSWEWDLGAGVVTRSAELCRLFGRDEASFGRAEGLTFEHIHPDDRVRVQAVLHDAVANRDGYAMDYRVVRTDGVVQIHSEGIVFRDESGSAVRVLGTGQDVTEHRRMQASLMFADRMASVGTLAAGVAHEINNPLAYVLANLDLLTEELAGLVGAEATARVGELAEMVAEARDGADRVRQIVQGLKAFSRSADERRAVFDVRVAVEAAVKLTRNELRQRARVVTRFGPAPPVMADEARLAQVFVNLLINAGQAIPEGSAEAHEIAVETGTRDDGRAVVEVRDTGEGMAPEVRARIFDPFFTTKPVGVGTGLGLSICHGIVSALGGEIQVESEAGGGTVVRVVLPAAEATDA